MQRLENIMRYVNPRTQHADVPTPLIAHYSLLTTHYLTYRSFFNEKRLKDGKSEGRIAAGSWTRGNKCKDGKCVCKDAERQPVPPIPVFADGRCMYISLSHGFENPRLFIFPSLTLSKLLTLGITQASLVLLSLNRNFQTFFNYVHRSSLTPHHSSLIAI